MNCPKCNNTLTLDEAEWHIGFTCARCYGIWLPPNYLESLRHQQPFDVSQFRDSLAKGKVESSKGLSCPSCTQPLATSNTNDVELDWCERCKGVWFDRQELTKLVTYQNMQANQPDIVSYLVEKSTDAYLKRHPEPLPDRKPDANGYVPNHIPAKERIQSSVFSVLLFSYGAFGVYINDLYLPGKRSRGLHLHNLSAWVMFGAMICACLIMLSVIVDHYDKRDNERNYRLFARIFKIMGWGFFVLSLILGIANK